SEETIQTALNEAGVLATTAALEQFDTDGSPLDIGSTRWTSKGQEPKTYQTPTVRLPWLATSTRPPRAALPSALWNATPASSSPPLLSLPSKLAPSTAGRPAAEWSRIWPPITAGM